MELRQEVIDKLYVLPESGIRMVLVVIDEILRQNQEKDSMEQKDAENKKMDAYKTILRMRKRNPFPAGFDYDKAREEAILDKYGSIN